MKRWHLCTTAGTLLGTFAFWADDARAASCDGIDFPDQVTIDQEQLVLNGLGIRKATVLRVKVYVAGLYLPQKTTDVATALGTSGDYELRLHFLRDVGVDDIRDAWQQGYNDNASGDLTALQDRIETLNSYMTDMQEGDVLTFSNNAGLLTVSINDNEKGTIEGVDFAGATLAIWLGEEPPNESLKSGLLGGECA